MKGVYPISAKIVATPTAGSWSYVFEFKKEETTVFIVVAKEQSEHISPEAIWNGQNPSFAQLKESVSVFESHFPQTNNLSYINQFVEATKDKFALLSGKFEIAVAATGAGQLTVTSFGDISALLLRDGQLVQLNKMNKAVTTVSGQLQASDVLCLATSAFVRLFPQGVLKATLSLAQPQAIVENLAPHVMSQNNAFLSSVFIVMQTDIAANPIKSEIPIKSSEGFVAPYMPKRGINTFLVTILDRIIAKLPTKQPLYVNPQERSNEAKSRKKLPILIGLMLLVILTISVVLGIQRQSKIRVENDFSDQLAVATSKLEEAKTLKGMNQTRARELLLEAKAIVDQLSTHEGKSVDYSLVAQSIAENLGEIGGIYVQNTNLFLDLALVSSGFTGQKLVASGGRMLVLDRERNKLVSIEVSTKKTQIIAGPSQLSNVIDIALYADRNFAMDSSAIKEIDGDPRIVVNSTWGNTAQMVAFAGNLYVLNPDQNMITRYNGSGGAFSDGTNWINEDTVADFSEVISFSVDGSFWLLEANGEVDKWSLGREEIFLLNGMSSNSEFIDLYTDEQLSDLYLLDARNSRIVVFDKRGAYIGEYQASEIADATELVVSEADQKIVFLSGSKLYSLDIKHE